MPERVCRVTPVLGHLPHRVTYIESDGEGTGSNSIEACRGYSLDPSRLKGPILSGKTVKGIDTHSVSPLTVPMGRGRNVFAYLGLGD